MKISYHAGRRLLGLLFLVPATVLCVMFIVVPLINVVKLSFVNWNGISKNMPFVGLENYRNLPNLEGFSEMAWATVIYAVGVTALTIVSAFLVALAINRKGKPQVNRGLMRCMWIFPALMSAAVVGIMWRIMYNYQNGLINNILVSLGGQKVNWLETYGVTMGAVIVASVWCQIGICSVIFLAGLQQIPDEMLEAAQIDGAGRIRTLFKIVIPQMAPSITINTITTTVSAFKAYELPMNVSNGLPGYSTRLLTQRVYFFSFESPKFGTASALSVILVLVITIISLIQLVALRSNEGKMK